MYTIPEIRLTSSSSLLPLLYNENNEVSNCKTGTILIKLGNLDISLYFKDKIIERRDLP